MTTAVGFKRLSVSSSLKLKLKDKRNDDPKLIAIVSNAAILHELPLVVVFGTEEKA